MRTTPHTPLEVRGRMRGLSGKAWVVGFLQLLRSPCLRDRLADGCPPEVPTHVGHRSCCYGGEDEACSDQIAPESVLDGAAGAYHERQNTNRSESAHQKRHKGPVALLRLDLGVVRHGHRGQQQRPDDQVGMDHANIVNLHYTALLRPRMDVFSSVKQCLSPARLS